MSVGEGPTSSRAGRGGGLAAALAGWLACALLIVYAALLHDGVGASPDSPTGSFWEPSGWLFGWLSGGALAPVAESTGLALLVLGLPALVLAALALLWSGSAIARWLSVSALIAVASVVYYAMEAARVWSFFGWRWSACIALFSLVVGAVLTAPLLVERWRRWGPPARALVVLPLIAVVLVIQRDLTGTDPSLRFAISPWPVIPVFGLEVVGSAFAGVFLGAALGLAALARASGREGGGAWGLRALALVAAAVTPALVLAASSAQGLLPFSAGAPTLTAGAALGLLVLAVGSSLGRAQAGARGRRAGHLGWAAALVGLPILAGQAWIALDYAETRHERAVRIIEAIDVYYEREGSYPRSLDVLVEAGELERIPEPRIGFGLLSDPDFTYQEFGTSYLLEFSAPRWVQCAYNPPHLPYEGEAVSEEDGEGDAEGVWTCPSEPPQLW